MITPVSNKNTSKETTLDFCPAGILRRIGAFSYDCLLLLAILFVTTALLLPFTEGEAIKTGNMLYSIYLFIVAFLFYGWFWTHGGQTLGMRAWKIRVEQLNGHDITWPQALHRFILMCMTFGLGLLWCFTNRERQAFFDRLTATRTVRL
ncbi:MAG: RDD family protein [Gammaproteobacteria bacterium]|nr:RDD family protein [Gammaproteobacteria bacterium]MCK5093003.1 RDD family protein [Gammaproteobacteria bacterium]